MSAPVVGAVLAGGRSGRMGSDKAWLDWHGSTLLERTVAGLRRALTGPVVVVRSRGQRLPALPADVLVIDDPAPGRGPLQGLATALAVADAPLVFACSTDLPLLHPALVRSLLARAQSQPQAEVVLPLVHGRRQHLTAFYRTAAAGRAAELVGSGRLAVADLVEALTAVLIDESELLADPAVAAADPRLESFVNLNTPGDYTRARALALPTVAVQHPDHPPVLVEAANLAVAAAAVAAGGEGAIRATLDGRTGVWSPHTPLFAGDTVSFGG